MAALRGECARDREPDAAARARDERDLSGERSMGLTFRHRVWCRAYDLVSLRLTANAILQRRGYTPFVRLRISERNSLRGASSLRKQPSNADRTAPRGR